MCGSERLRQGAPEASRNGPRRLLPRSPLWTASPTARARRRGLTDDPAIHDPPWTDRPRLADGVQRPGLPRERRRAPRDQRQLRCVYARGAHPGARRARRSHPRAPAPLQLRWRQRERRRRLVAALLGHPHRPVLGRAVLLAGRRGPLRSLLLRGAPVARRPGAHPVPPRSPRPRAVHVPDAARQLHAHRPGPWRRPLHRRGRARRGPAHRVRGRAQRRQHLVVRRHVLRFAMGRSHSGRHADALAPAARAGSRRQPRHVLA